MYTVKYKLNDLSASVLRLYKKQNGVHDNGASCSQQYHDVLSVYLVHSLSVGDY